MKYEKKKLTAGEYLLYAIKVIVFFVLLAILQSCLSSCTLRELNRTYYVTYTDSELGVEAGVRLESNSSYKK